MTLPPPNETQAGGELLVWLVAQSVALAIALVRVWGQWLSRKELARELMATQTELATFRERNELLSAALLRSIESASLERSKLSDARLWLLDSTIRSFVDLLSQVLGNALTLPESLREPSSKETE